MACHLCAIVSNVACSLCGQALNQKDVALFQQVLMHSTKELLGRCGIKHSGLWINNLQMAGHLVEWLQ